MHSRLRRQSGSRAWGFASRDSDYDVRFLYVHRQDWYLSVEDRRDVIELPISEDLDVSGWELRKALRLLRKSNPPLLEWLKSPIVYRYDPAFAAEFGALAAEFYSPRRCFAHYLHMAFGNWRDYLRGRESVSLKKYLYVFRPLLAQGRSNTTVLVRGRRDVASADFSLDALSRASLRGVLFPTISLAQP